MIKAVFFDMDGTLVPIEQDAFVKMYFELFTKKLSGFGYDPADLLKNIWTGIKLMYKNDGSKSNEQVFWGHFVSVYGEKALQDKHIIDAFYLNEFKQIKVLCKPNPHAVDMVKYVHDKGLACILSTNPLFPMSAQTARLEFVGLKESDFDMITAYENFGLCKPNPKYFECLLQQLNLKKEEVIVFGNNDTEDYLCATQAGLECYLIGDMLILDKDKHIDCPKIQYDEFYKVIDKHLK